MAPKEHHITKTDFIHYTRCPKSFWLSKRHPDRYPKGEVSEFLQRIAREGYEVERYAQQLFPDGVTVPATKDAAERTAIALKTERVLFQPTFNTESGLFARIDILERNEDATYSLYEVKSSTSIKRTAAHDQIKDACFQYTALCDAGIAIREVYLIHVNKDYVFRGAIEPEHFLVKQRVTDLIKEYEEEVRVQAQLALKLIAEETIDETACPCYYKTRTNHCDAFEVFNGVKERNTVWELCGIREKKLCTLLERNITKLEEVPEDIPLNDRQKIQVRSAQLKSPIINQHFLNEQFSALEFPLHFFDYETAASAVPSVIGTSPWQQLPFQFSLHLLSEDGTLEHVEYIAQERTDGKEVVEALIKNTAPRGSFISWHASFELSRNREMAKRYPELREPLEKIQHRMVDLEAVVKEGYGDSTFCGSTSIKKVLPVLCPELSYTSLTIQDGTQAMEQWFALVNSNDADNRATLYTALSEYCALDTFAMVALYRKLKACAETS